MFEIDAKQEKSIIHEMDEKIQWMYHGRENLQVVIDTHKIKKMFSQNYFANILKLINITYCHTIQVKIWYL